MQPGDGAGVRGLGAAGAGGRAGAGTGRGIDRSGGAGGGVARWRRLRAARIARARLVAARRRCVRASAARRSRAWRRARACRRWRASVRRWRSRAATARCLRAELTALAGASCGLGVAAGGVLVGVLGTGDAGRMMTTTARSTTPVPRATKAIDRERLLPTAVGGRCGAALTGVSRRFRPRFRCRLGGRTRSPSSGRPAAPRRSPAGAVSSRLVPARPLAARSNQSSTSLSSPTLSGSARSSASRGALATRGSKNGSEGIASSEH